MRMRVLCLKSFGVAAVSPTGLAGITQTITWRMKLVIAALFDRNFVPKWFSRRFRCVGSEQGYFTYIFYKVESATPSYSR
jgi:hypothetical protein